MESLLSLSFANISSRDAAKIKKGFRQIEGLLIQICLSNPPKSASTSLVEIHEPPTEKPLQQLPEDPAFREFFRLQDGFEYNATTHLITSLERLLSMPPNASNDNLLLSGSNLIQGMLLLHPPSRTLFSREVYMNLLMDLLSPSLPPKIHISTLTVLTIALMDQSSNIRVFERADGLLAVTALLREKDLHHAVRKSVMEFMYFYLLPETEPNGEKISMNSTTRRCQRSGSRPGHGAEMSEWRDVSEKHSMLGRYVSEVTNLPEQFDSLKIYDGMFTAV